MLQSRDAIEVLSAYLVGQLPLGWSQYVALLTIDNADDQRRCSYRCSAVPWADMLRPLRGEKTGVCVMNWHCPAPSAMKWGANA